MWWQTCCSHTSCTPAHGAAKVDQPSARHTRLPATPLKLCDFSSLNRRPPHHPGSSMRTAIHLPSTSVPTPLQLTCRRSKPPAPLLVVVSCRLPWLHPCCTHTHARRRAGTRCANVPSSRICPPDHSHPPGPRPPTPSPCPAQHRRGMPAVQRPRRLLHVLGRQPAPARRHRPGGGLDGALAAQPAAAAARHHHLHHHFKAQHRRHAVAVLHGGLVPGRPQHEPQVRQLRQAGSGSGLCACMARLHLVVGQKGHARLRWAGQAGGPVPRSCLGMCV